MPGEFHYKQLQNKRFHCKKLKTKIDTRGDNTKPKSEPTRQRLIETRATWHQKLRRLIELLGICSDVFTEHLAYAVSRLLKFALIYTRRCAVGAFL